MKKKLLTLFCAAFMAFTVTACGSESSGSTSSSSASESVESTESTESKESSESTEKKEDQQLVVTSENAKLIGRTYSKDNILWFSLSGSGAEFKFNGKRCEVMVRADSMVTQKQHSPRFAVYVDGERLMDKVMEQGIEKVEVLNTENAEEHIVRVVKLSESADSTMGLVYILCEGEATVEPTPAKDLKIEFIGDSITCGYGVDGKLGEVYSTSNEDCTKAYAIKTANKLDADYSLFSFSGHGIISGYSGDGNKVESQLIPNLYTKFGNSYGTFALGTKPFDIEWDFTKYVPDVVVINLGTNDASYTKGQADRIEDYTVHYVEFLKQVREKNPDAQIVCVLGVMGQDLCPALEDAVGRYKTETGDNEVYYLKLDQQGSEVVVDYHPTEASHEHAADQVSEFIKSILKQ